jgi:hypothetical protein
MLFLLLLLFKWKVYNRNTMACFKWQMVAVLPDGLVGERGDDGHGARFNFADE